MPPYKISLINSGTEETRTNNDLIVVKGVVEREDQLQDYNENLDSDSSNSDEDEGENWPNDIKILQNSTILVPFRSHGKAFTFIVTLIPGMNAIDFVSTDGNETSFKKLIYNYESPEMQGDGHGDVLLRSVVPMLILCRDEELPESLIQSTMELIRLGMKISQAFFEEKLFEHGLDRKSFHVSSNVEILRMPSLSMHQMSRISAEKVWEMVACQIKSSDELWNPLYKYVGFLSQSCRLVTDSLAPKTADRLACGGGGLALIGFNSFATWPKDSDSILDAVFTDTKLLTHPLLEMTVYLGHLDNTAGSLYCAAMGALAHELGHIFDLGHSENGLMGTDFYKFEQFLAPVQEIKIDCFGCTELLPPGYTTKGTRKSVKPIAISLTHSSAKILARHKWFMGAHDFDVLDQRPTLIKNKLRSSFPLDVVEVRHIDNGVVYKTLGLSDNTCELLLSKRDIPIECGDVAVFVAQDCKGNLLKATVARCDLPSMFTTLNLQ